MLKISEIKKSLFEENDLGFFRDICHLFQGLADEFTADELTRLPVAKQAVIVEELGEKLPGNCLLVLCRNKKGIRQNLRNQSIWESKIQPRLQLLQPSKWLTKAAIAALIAGGMVLAGGVVVYEYLKGRTG